MENAGTTGAVIWYKGIVQGVGFRPLAYRRAHLYRLRGTIRNTETGVHIELDGSRRSIEQFYRDVLKNPPVLAEIHTSSIEYTKPHGFTKLRIAGSTAEGEGFTPISPDIATCDNCLEEVFDPNNRRYLYPFTNCTDCGPRFTIIQSVPYDRKNTTMSEFVMCSDCRAEYENPLDRRYHAQPNACPVCGPSLELRAPDGSVIEKDALDNAVSLLEQGAIVAVKGLGGYHLAVSPQRPEWVMRLRKMKRRPAKPFALMARDMPTIRKYCIVGERAEDLLAGFERPIVLLRGRKGKLPNEIAPDTDCIGIMLPYTPLHHILLREGPEILIMTSANVSEEPLVYRDDEASEELTGIADAFLVHNRKIQRPCDDSVFFVSDGVPVPVRRSRGYVPKAIPVGPPERTLLAFGPNEKNTFCVFREEMAYVSHHIGDLNNTKSIDAYTAGIQDFLSMLRVEPEILVCDIHPDYISTRIAERMASDRGIHLERVQHHHAHIASVLGEADVNDAVIGVALDGTGYGTDETIWGGEFLIATQKDFTRAARYFPVPMPGGEKAIIETDRMAVSYLLHAFGSASGIPDFPFIVKYDKKKLALFEKMIHSGINCPRTSSCGRLFDAVSALIGLCVQPSYDAQPAVLLETAAGPPEALSLSPENAYSYSIDDGMNLHFEPAIREIVSDMQGGSSRNFISQKFHAAVILSGVDVCRRLRKKTGINTIALSGGVFQNRIILKLIRRLLSDNNFSVLFHRLMPPNDGGISFGQGIVARRRCGRGVE